MCQFLRLGGPFCLVTHSIINSKKFHKYLSALANFFVGFHEERLFDYDQKPGVYFRYVDDTYTIFKTEAECDTFLKHLNNLHPALQFTFEKEENDSLPFFSCFGRKVQYRISYQCISQTYFYRSVHTLEFILPKTTQSQPCQNFST